MDEKKHLLIFGPFRASRISFIHWTPNHKSNLRSLTADYRGLESSDLRVPVLLTYRGFNLPRPKTYRGPKLTADYRGLPRFGER